jgi:hypothetical protein
MGYEHGAAGELLASDFQNLRMLMNAIHVAGREQSHLPMVPNDHSILAIDYRYA